jgi:hypothetical protein
MFLSNDRGCGFHIVVARCSTARSSLLHLALFGFFLACARELFYICSKSPAAPANGPCLFAPAHLGRGALRLENLVLDPTQENSCEHMRVLVVVDVGGHLGP